MERKQAGKTSPVASAGSSRSSGGVPPPLYWPSPRHTPIVFTVCSRSTTLPVLSIIRIYARCGRLGRCFLRRRTSLVRLVALTFALNYAWSEYETWSYHLVNILVHVLAALALFGIVRRTLAKPFWGQPNPPLLKCLACSTEIVKSILARTFWAIPACRRR